MSFLNRFKLYGNKVETFENTRRAVLTKFGFIIESDIEVEDHPEFLKKKSDIESRSAEMATKHDKEVWTYIAQGFPGSKERPTAQMVGERLKANPDFRSGLLKLQDRHKSEYSALKGELKSAVEDNEIYKQESRSEQVRSMSPEQKRELVGEKSRARYQTEEGKLDRQYRNINHYGRQGERIKTVQRTRYQEDEDFRAKQIERSRARLQKPGIKELGAAEARERTRLRNNPLNEQCDCGCNGNLKTHRANFRKKFWSEYNPVKEGGFKIFIAGIDNDAYWSGESWRRCITAVKKQQRKTFSRDQLNKWRKLPKSSYMSEWGKREFSILGDGSEEFHGTNAGSRTLGCRCIECRNFIETQKSKSRKTKTNIQKNKRIKREFGGKDGKTLTDIKILEGPSSTGRTNRANIQSIKPELEELNRSLHPKHKLICGLCSSEIKPGSPTELEHTEPVENLKKINPNGREISGLNDLKFTHKNCHKKKTRANQDNYVKQTQLPAEERIGANEIHEIMNRAPKTLGVNVSQYIRFKKDYYNKVDRNKLSKTKELFSENEKRGMHIFGHIQRFLNFTESGTGNKRNEKDINWNKILSESFLAASTKLKTKKDKESGDTLIFQNRRSYINYASDNAEKYTREIKSQDNNLQYQNILKGRYKKNPQLYDNWMSHPDHKLNICNDCGRDSAQLGHNIEIDHDTQELERYPEKGRFMHPVKETEMRCGHCHEIAQQKRDEERKTITEAGNKKPKEIEEHMREFALDYRKKMGRGQNKSWGRSKNTVPGEFKVSSWNGFKILDNL